MSIQLIEQLLSTGAYLQARREAERLLSEGELPPGDHGRVCWLACQACLSLQDLFTAARFGEQAVEKAQDAGDLETLGKAHFDLGCAYVRIGDAHQAETHLQAFLSQLPTLKESEPREAAAYYQLAIVYRQRKEWPRAVATLQRAAWLYGRTGQHRERAQTALDQAWGYLMMQQPAAAAPHLEAVAAYLQEHRDDQLQARLLCERALYFRLTGDPSASSALCQEVFAPGRPGVGDHELGEAAWIMGENALDLGRVQEAGVFAGLALNHAVKANWPSLMNLACDLRRRIVAAKAPGA